MNKEKEILNEMLKHLRLIEEKKHEMSENLLELRTFLAEEMGYQDSDGEPEASAIKTAPLNKLISYIETGKNKIEEELELFEKYQKIIQKDSVLSRKVKSYLEMKNNKKEIESLLSDIKKAAKSHLEPEEFDKVILASKEIIKAEKNETPIDIYIKNQKDTVEYKFSVIENLLKD